MVVGVRSGEEVEGRHALAVERRRVGGKVGVVGEREIEAPGHVRALDDAGPDAGRTHRLDGQPVLLEPPHHVQVDVGRELAGIDLVPEERPGTEEAHFLPGPETDQYRPGEGSVGNRARQREHRRRPRRVVVRPGMDGRGRVGVQGAAATHPQVVVVGPHGDVGRIEAAVRRRQDPDHVRAAGGRPLEVHGKGGEPGQREGPGVHLAGIEGSLHLGQGNPGPREEAVTGSPVDGDGEDALAARRRDVETVRGQFPGAFGPGAGDHHHPGRPLVPRRRRLRPEVGVAVQDGPRLVLHVVGEVAEDDHHLVPDLVTGVAVVAHSGALGNPDAVTGEMELSPHLPGLRERECLHLVAPETLVSAGPERGPPVLHSGNETEGDPEAVPAGERPGARGLQLGDQVAPGGRRPRGPHRAAFGARSRECEHVVAKLLGSLARGG